MFRQIVRGPQQDMPTMLMIHYLENIVNMFVNMFVNMYVLCISVILFAMHGDMRVRSWSNPHCLVRTWSGENNGTENHVFLQQKVRT